MTNRKTKAFSARLAVLALCVLAVAAVIAVAPMPPASDAGGQTPHEVAADAAGSIRGVGDEDAPEAGGAGEGRFEVADWFEPGVVLVVLDEGASPDQAIEVLAEESGLSGLSLVSATSNFVKLALPEGVEVEEAMQRMEGSSVVAQSQPNYRYYIQDDPADSGSLLTGGLVAQTLDPLAAQGESLAASSVVNDEFVDNQWALEEMHVPEAWEQLLAAGRIFDEPKADGAVGVAVIDEGFNVNHEDIKNVIVETYNAVDKGSDVSEVMGQKGHGTHVAGIVAAQSDNGIGVAGVSHNAKLMLVKVCGEGGSMTTDTLVDAYDHIMDVSAQHNIRVISMSLGGYIPPDDQQEYDQLFLEKIDEAYEKGIVTVCSAGNSATHAVPYYNYPSDYHTVVSVINLGKNGMRNTSSNYNDPSNGDVSKDISAPGTSIYSTFFHGYSSDKDKYTDEENNVYYGYNSGSSMSAPQVAGVFVLMFAAAPSLTADEAVSKLYSTATDLEYTRGNETASEGWDPYTGFGEVNAQAAVESSYFIRGKTSLDVGSSVQLSYSGAADALTWSSSNEKVAAVTNDGLVAGVGAGRASITATDGKHEAVAVVNVVAPKIVGLTSVEYGKSAVYRVTSVIGGDWEWSTSNPEVAEIDSTGRLAAVAAGTVTVRAVSKANSAVFAELKIAVTRIPQSMTVTGLTKSVKYAKVKKAAQDIGKIVRVKDAQGTVTYEKASGNRKIVVNKKTGEATVKKGLEKGVYKVVVRVYSSATASYKSDSKKAVAVVRVK